MSLLAYGVGGALAAETLDLAVGVDLVVLEDGELGLLALVLDLLGSLETEEKVEKRRRYGKMLLRTEYCFFFLFFPPPRRRRTR